MNALEFMKEDRTGKLITGTNTCTVEIIYIKGTDGHQKGFKNFGFTDLDPLMLVSGPAQGKLENILQ